MDAALGSWTRRPLHATTGQFTTLLARIEYRREEERRRREKKQHDAEINDYILIFIIEKILIII